LKPTDAELQSGITRAQAAAGSELADGRLTSPHAPACSPRRSLFGEAFGFGLRRSAFFHPPTRRAAPAQTSATPRREGTPPSPAAACTTP
jgi:hypothetical protein